MKRASGVLLNISSLYGDYGIGSFGNEAISFIDFLSEAGFTYWQVLPFCLPDECNSPYKSYSTFGGNPYFVNLDSLFDEGLLSSEDIEKAKQGTPYYCEFDRLKTERLPLLIKASKNIELDFIDITKGDTQITLGDKCQKATINAINNKRNEVHYFIKGLNVEIYEYYNNQTHLQEHGSSLDNATASAHKFNIQGSKSKISVFFKSTESE